MRARANGTAPPVAPSFSSTCAASTRCSVARKDQDRHFVRTVQLVFDAADEFDDDDDDDDHAVQRIATLVARDWRYTAAATQQIMDAFEPSLRAIYGRWASLGRRESRQVAALNDIYQLIAYDRLPKLLAEINGNVYGLIDGFVADRRASCVRCCVHCCGMCRRSCTIIRSDRPSCISKRMR